MKQDYTAANEFNINNAPCANNKISDSLVKQGERLQMSYPSKYVFENGQVRIAEQNTHKSLDDPCHSDTIQKVENGELRPDNGNQGKSLETLPPPLPQRIITRKRRVNSEIIEKQLGDNTEE